MQQDNLIKDRSQKMSSYFMLNQHLAEKILASRRKLTMGEIMIKTFQLISRPANAFEYQP